METFAGAAAKNASIANTLDTLNKQIKENKANADRELKDE